MMQVALFGIAKLLPCDSHLSARTCFFIGDSFGVETSSPPSKHRAGRSHWTCEHLQMLCLSRAASLPVWWIASVTADDCLNLLWRGKAGVWDVIPRQQLQFWTARSHCLFVFMGVCVGLCYRTWETHCLLKVGCGRIYRCWRAFCVPRAWPVLV